jgi:hypothetical protein
MKVTNRAQLRRTQTRLSWKTGEKVNDTGASEFSAPPPFNFVENIWAYLHVITKIIFGATFRFDTEKAKTTSKALRPTHATG